MPNLRFLDSVTAPDGLFIWIIFVRLRTLSSLVTVDVVISIITILIGLFLGNSIAEEGYSLGQGIQVPRFDGGGLWYYELDQNHKIKPLLVLVSFLLSQVLVMTEGIMNRYIAIS